MKMKGTGLMNITFISGNDKQDLFERSAMFYQITRYVINESSIALHYLINGIFVLHTAQGVSIHG